MEPIVMVDDYVLRAFIEEKGQRRPFNLAISAAARSEADDYYCRVHAPALLDGDKDIYGVDAEQAARLALEFVESLLVGKRLLDEHGQPIQL
jgi:hypothetical protein